MASCALIVSACTHTTKTPLAAAPATVPALAGKGCARVRSGGAARLGSARESSALALATIPAGENKRVVAYIADSDEPTLHTVDLAGPTEIANVAVSSFSKAGR